MRHIPWQYVDTDNIRGGNMLLLLAYILIGILYWRLNAVSGRLEELESRRTTPVAPPAPAPEQHAPAEPPSPRPAPVIRAPKPAPVYTEPVFAPTPAPSPVEEVPTMFDRMAETSGGWEELIGGNLLNKLGALVLVIGIALFLSFSFSNMGPTGRAATAAAVSIATLAGGIFTETKERYRIFARGIIAAGWAGLYFTTYAMYALPAAQVIESPVLGTLLMVAVAVGMVGHSLRYRVESLTALSFGCIFGALALSPMNTFAAISLVPLAAAMLYLARRFDWHALALFAAAGTYTVFLTRPPSGSPLANIQAMLVIFWAMFEGFDLLRVRSKTAVEQPLSLGLFGLNAIAGLSASATLWNRMAPDSMWLFAAGAAALYLASAWIRFALDGETYYEFSLVISSVLTGLAIFARVPGLWTSMGLMLQAEALFLAAHFLRVRAAKVLSWLGFLAALASTHWSGSQTTILGSFDVHNFTPPLVILAGLLYLNRFLSKEETYWSYFASAFVGLVVCAESSNERVAGTMLLAWSALLFEFGVQKGLREFRIQSYIAAPVSALITLVMVLNDAWDWTFAVAAAVFYIQALRATRGLAGLSGAEHTFLRFAGSLGATTFTGVLIHQIAPAPYEAVYLMAASILIAELGLRGLPKEMLRSAVLMNGGALLRLLSTHSVGIEKHPDPAVAVAFGGAAITYYWFAARFLRTEDPVLTIVRYGASSLASVFALVTLWMLVPAPLVPIAFAALALLTLEAGLARKAEDLTWLGRAISIVSAFALLHDVPESVSARIGLSAVIAATQLVIRFRIRGHLLSAAHGMLAAFIIAATLWNDVDGGMLTLSWSVEAIVLLAIGFMGRDRWLRLAGLGFLLVCIGKVFLYDLRNLDQFYRILSFIGLGVILLAVSWIYTRFKEQLQKLL